MGRDLTYRYSVEMTTVAGYNTPAGWPTRNRNGDRRPAELLGKPTDGKLRQYVLDYNVSLHPGAVNAHLGERAALRLGADRRPPRRPRDRRVLPRVTTDRPTRRRPPVGGSSGSAIAPTSRTPIRRPAETTATTRDR